MPPGANTGMDDSDDSDEFDEFDEFDDSDDSDDEVAGYDRADQGDPTDVQLDSEVDFDDEAEDDQLPLDQVEAAELGVDLDDPDRLADD